MQHTTAGDTWSWPAGPVLWCVPRVAAHHGLHPAPRHVTDRAPLSCPHSDQHQTADVSNLPCGLIRTTASPLDALLVGSSVKRTPVWLTLMRTRAALQPATCGDLSQERRRPSMSHERSFMKHRGRSPASADFWSRTLQNWQSEFLAVGSMVVFSIYLRERGSPESKPVGQPHHSTGIEGWTRPGSPDRRSGPILTGPGQRPARVQPRRGRIAVVTSSSANHVYSCW